MNPQKQLFYLICHNSTKDKSFLAYFFLFYSELNSLFFGILDMHIDCLVFEIFNKLSNAFFPIFDLNFKKMSEYVSAANIVFKY